MGDQRDCERCKGTYLPQRVLAGGFRGCCLRGALDAAALVGALSIDGREKFDALASELDVPVLLIEAAQTYDLDAVEALATSWPTMRRAS